MYKMQLLVIIFTILGVTVVYTNNEERIGISDIKTYLNGSSNITNDSLNQSATSQQTVLPSEGGSHIVQPTNSSNELSYIGREHVSTESMSSSSTEVVDAKPSNSSILQINYSNISVSTTENSVSKEQKKNAHSVPRKGVNYTEAVLLNSSSQINISVMFTTTTEKPIVKKPTITENFDGEFEPLKHKSEAQLQPVNNLLVENKEHNSATYVIPIVGVILSVPLVAIVTSIIYKRGSEWWQHRHYRRMDFLIEGMYNN